MIDEIFDRIYDERTTLIFFKQSAIKSSANAMLQLM